MKIQSSLPAIRINPETKENILRAIEQYNKTSLVQLKVTQFRRLSYELLSQMILQKKELPVKIITD